MQYTVLRTNEINIELWNEFILEFNAIFLRKTSPEEFRRYYCSNAFGYSYHCFAFSSNGAIAGYTAIIPFYYTLFKERMVIGVGGGSFVKKEYRKDIFVLRDIWNCLRNYCLKDGIIAFLGISNVNSFRYSLEILKRTHLGNLKYYILPVHPMKILKRKKLRWLDSFFRALSYLFLLSNILLSYLLQFKEDNSKIKINLYKEFYDHRFYKDYTEIQSGNTRFYYKILIENGIKTAYLMDFREKGRRSYYSLSRSLLEIIRLEKIDLILFIGTLRMKQLAMFCLPDKKEPKKLPVVIDLLCVDNPSRYESLLDLNNWELSLMNFDLR
jgi:hypothetical protein